MTYLLVALLLSGLGGDLPLVGYAQQHAGFWHLALNAFGLLTLGLGVERRAGPWLLLGLYLTAVAAAGAAHGMWGPPVPLVGASGGVLALLGAYAAFDPAKQVVVLGIPMRAGSTVAGYIIVSLGCIAFGWLPGLAHVAHLAGITYGYAWGRQYVKDRTSRHFT